MQKQQSMTTGMRLQTVLAMTCLVLLSGYSISRALQASSGMMSEAEAAELSSRPAPAADAATIQLTPIEQLQVGDRVLANAPTEEVDLQFGTDIVPTDWRKVTLQAPKRDGSTADVILLRPLTWLNEQRQSGTSFPTESTLTDGEPLESFHNLVGGTVFISVPECGIDGHAQVLAIEPCPEILPGEGRVITGTFRHQVSASISLSIAGQAEPILCTGNHPFWSEDRHDFVRADSLQPNETLRTTTGTTTVTSLSHIPGSTPVYNLEVHGTHVYHVGTSGVLVHNGDPCPLAEALFNLLLRTVSHEGKTVTVIGRMDDLTKFGDDVGFDTWLKSAPNGRFTLPKNREWIMERVRRGDVFALATDPSTLSTIFGQGVGYYTAKELQWLAEAGIEVLKLW